MSNRNADNTIIVLGLTLLESLLPISGYPEDVRKAMVERIRAIVEDIQRPPPAVDAYGNPYEQEWKP